MWHRGSLLDELASLATVAGVDLLSEWQASIDRGVQRGGVFAPISKAEMDAEIGRLEAGIAERERELGRREKVAELERVRGELERIEA
jgi:hypothetical protein